MEGEAVPSRAAPQRPRRDSARLTGDGSPYPLRTGFRRW